MTELFTGTGEGPVHEAATVVLLRDVGGGVECLMLRKTQGQAFGGLWVFPGGRIETGDGTGLDGARRAAVREAEEETGLVLDADSLVPLSHWEPPPEAPRRYNTWFFVAGLPDGASEVIVDGGEIGDHVWTRPEAALQAHDHGDIELLPPTWVTLRTLCGHPDVAAALDAVAAREADRFATRMARDEDGRMVSLWEGDAAYPADPAASPGPLDAPGARHRLYMDPAGWRYERSAAG
ncbi:MAG TPA: NUDIX hydrolase [Acidimicrobiales bacterium]